MAAHGTCLLRFELVVELVGLLNAVREKTDPSKYVNAKTRCHIIYIQYYYSLYL